MKLHEGIDSKFRFVILASLRAKELLRGSKSKIKSKSKNPIRIAQLEVNEGLVGFEIVEPKKEEIPVPRDEDFIGEEIGVGENETGEESKIVAKRKKKKSEGKPKKKLKKEPSRKKKKEE